MIKKFGTMPNGEQASLYTITCGGITASVTDCGASLMGLTVPDKNGNLADVVLGYDSAEACIAGRAHIGATVGRNANRIKNASFRIGGREYRLTPNEHENNLHSGPNAYHIRLWKVTTYSESSIRFFLRSPSGDQGFPGNADISVTYTLDANGGLHILYDGVCDQDTVFNMTNHSYFNLAGHDHPEKAMGQLLTLPARFFTPADAQSIPTGEIRAVADTPMDFRTPKPIGQDIGNDYEPLRLQGGYDHNFEVFCNPCAVVKDPESGRTMTISTDCPGIQFYSGNHLNEQGKSGVHYGTRGAIALEPQFYPDALHHENWAQPIVKAGVPYHSETVYRFFW